MQLEQALSDIAEIRARIEQAQVFRGYRAATVAFSGFVACATGLAQAWLVPQPRENLEAYLTLWLSAAALAFAATAGEVLIRYRATVSDTERARSRQAARQFLPCVVAGGLLTAVIVRSAPSAAWMLPGLWCILFSLGVFASLPILPREVVWVGAFYLACGLASVAWGQGERSLSPWLMAAPFGFGQAWAAAILYFKLERRHGTDEETC
jgi:multisubunit Na+/H+ antiporter MnhB subunit